MKRIGIPYVGGKLSKLDFLLPLVPNHKTYIEPFGGSGALLLNKPKSKVEIYNDLDGELVNFFCVLRNHYNEFIKRFEYLPLMSEEEFYIRKKEMGKGDDITRAVNYIYCLMNSFSNKFSTFRYAYNKKQFTLSKLKTLQLISKRLKEVVILHRDAIKILNTLLKSTAEFNKVFIYLDPPYLEETLTSNSQLYRVPNHKDDFHSRLLDLMLELDKKGVKMLLSGYDNNLYNRLKGWNTKEFETVTTLNNFKHSKRIEKVWFNYDIKQKKLNFTW